MHIPHFLRFVCLLDFYITLPKFRAVYSIIKFKYTTYLKYSDGNFSGISSLAKMGGGAEERRLPKFVGPLLPSTKSLAEDLCLEDPEEWKKIAQGTNVTWQRVPPGQGQRERLWPDQGQ